MHEYIQFIIAIGCCCCCCYLFNSIIILSLRYIHSADLICPPSSLSISLARSIWWIHTEYISVSFVPRTFVRIVSVYVSLPTNISKRSVFHILFSMAKIEYIKPNEQNNIKKHHRIANIAINYMEIREIINNNDCEPMVNCQKLQSMKMSWAFHYPM